MCCCKHQVLCCKTFAEKSTLSQTSDAVSARSKHVMSQVLTSLALFQLTLHFYPPAKDSLAATQNLLAALVSELCFSRNIFGRAGSFMFFRKHRFTSPRSPITLLSPCALPCKPTLCSHVNPAISHLAPSLQHLFCPRAPITLLSSYALTAVLPCTNALLSLNPAFSDPRKIGGTTFHPLNRGSGSDVDTLLRWLEDGETVQLPQTTSLWLS